MFYAFAVIAAFCTWSPSNASAQDYARLFKGFSAANLSYDDKRFLQTALAFEGHYFGLLDGDWGRLSQRALDGFSKDEFQELAQDWHMVLLALTYFDRVSQDGWGMYHNEPLGLSFLYPFDAVRDGPYSDNFINWEHAKSSLSYSATIGGKDTTENLHSFTLAQSNDPESLYMVRNPTLLITSASKSDGSTLYTRSNYVHGKWSTLMLSASAGDKDTLNAV
ncbi:MAG: serine protease, partial [Myxococcota bacterium]